MKLFTKIAANKRRAGAFAFRVLMIVVLCMVAGRGWGQTNNYFGTSGTMSGNVWSTNPAGPYNSALVTTGGPILNFNNSGSVTSTSIAVAVGFNFGASMTWVAGGTIGAAGINLPINISTGISQSLGGQGFSTSTTAAITKNGLGELGMSGGTFKGGFTLNSGTLAAGGINALGNGSVTINGGTISGTGNLSFAGKLTGMTVAGDFTFGASTALSLGTANLIFDANMALGSTTHTITIGGAGTYTLGGIISGANGTGLTINSTAAGILLFTNTANTYNGTTTISSGELRLSPSSSPATFASQIKLNGGKLSTTGIPALTILTSSSTLNLNATSTIALESTNTHSLKFAASDAISWASGAVLTITGWSGTVGNGSTGSVGKIFVGTTSGGLTASQLAQIEFSISGINYPATILSSGEIVPTLKYAITSLSPATPTAGAGFSVTVQSQDFNGTARNVITTSSAFSLSTNNNAGAISGTTTGSITNGTSSIIVNNVILASAGTGVTLTATNTSGDILLPGTSAPFTVNASGSPTKLVITSVTPSSPTKNSSFSVTVQSEDNSNTVQNVTTNTTVNLARTTGTGTLSGTLSGVINSGSNSITFSGLTYDVAEAGVVLTASDQASLLTSGTTTFAVLEPASQLAFVGVPGTGNIGVNLSTFTVEARRPDNSVDDTYTGNVTITKASGSGNLSGTTIKAAVNGIATFNDLQFDAVDTYTITANSGSLSSTTSSSIVITDVSLTTDYYRSFTTGLWSDIGTWESSHDNSTWISATLTPTSAANIITIRNGHNITVSSSVSVDQVVVANGGTLTYSGGVLTVNNSTGDDISIQNGGIVVYALASTTPTFSSGATLGVNSGGILRIQTTGITANNSGVNSANHIYYDGGILEWNAVVTATPSASGVTYFPNVDASTVPIFRFLIGPNNTVGGINPTVINGKIEISSGVTVTFDGSGAKTFRNGIIGAGNLVQGSTTPSGQFIVNGSTAELGGLGTITIGANGLSIPAGTTTLSSDKVANTGTITVSGTGTLVTGTFQLSGSSPVTINSGGTLKVGSTSASDAVTGNIPTGTVTLNTGSTVEFNGAGAQFAAARTFSNLTINNSAGVTMIGNVTAGGTLNLASGILGINGQTLTINGPLAGSGTLTGSSTSNLVIGGTAQGQSLNFTQTTAATRSLNNLTLNAASTATLVSALDLYGTMTIDNTGLLDLNIQNLTLKSDANNTARIAALNALGTNLTGATDVTVERFIKLRSPGTGAGTGNYGRAYRLLAPTVNTASSIRNNWMEGQNNTATGYVNNSNTVPNYGTHITGAGGAGNGFDETVNNQSSLYLTTNGTTLTYTPVGSTTGTLDALTGYFLFVRGDRSMDINLPATTNMPTSSTTLRTTGGLLTGDQSVFANALQSGAGTLNLVTNPYASPIDWSLVFADATDITDAYTYWDPNLGTRGGFATVNTAGATSTVETGTVGGTKFIQSGQAFFVQSANGNTPTLTIKESHKFAGNNNAVFRVTTALESFRTTLYFTEPSGYHRAADGAIAVFDNSYSAALDVHDAFDIDNWDENIAIARNGKHLAIESRPVVQQKDTIPLFISNMKQQAYEFQFVPSNFTNTALKAELIDNFLGTRTLLSVMDTVVAPFSITANPASSATDRFMIVFAPLAPLAIDETTIKAYQKNTGAQVEWTAKTENNMDHYEVERSFDGAQFSKQTTVAAIGNSSVAVNYSWYDAGAQVGNNFYRIKAVDKSGQVKYTSIVKVTIGKGEPGISIYPNPLSDNNLGLQFRNIDKGMYMISMYNNLGQKVYSSPVQHPGGTLSITVTLPASMVPGTYQLVLTGENNVKLTSTVIKN